MKSLHWLFKDTPARREDYEKVVNNSHPQYPLKFCKTRWIENGPVVERAMVIFQDVQKYINLNPHWTLPTGCSVDSEHRILYVSGTSYERCESKTVVVSDIEMSWKCPGNVLEFHSIKSVGTL